MISDILKHYKLTRDLNMVGFYESKELMTVEASLREHIQRGHFVSLTGPVGAGKTTLVRRVIGELKKSRTVEVSESQALEKDKITITSIVHALFMDLGEKIDRDRESRDRKLFRLIEQKGRKLVFFIDDAHQMQTKTLTGLKSLVEHGLSVVLVGHPRLSFRLARGQMEEIGMRCERLEMKGLGGEAKVYLEWLIKQAGGSITIFAQEAREEIASLCRTPLQVKRIAWEAIKQGYEEGEKQISRETILSVISPDYRDIRTELKRIGYTVRDIAYDYGITARQVNRFLDGKLAAEDPALRQLSAFLKTAGVAM